MKFESFLSIYIGEFGPFQLLVATIAGLTVLVNEPIANNFIGGYQEHWCQIPELEQLPFDQQKYIGIPQDSRQHSLYASCSAINVSYSNYTTTDFYYWNRTAASHSSNVSSCSKWIYDQSQYVSTIMSKWNLVCGREWMVTFISSVTMLGYLFGSLLAGVLSDKYGRVRIIFLFLVLRIISNFLSALAPNYATFIIARLLNGMTIMGGYIIVYVYVSEITSSKYRSLTGISLQVYDSTGCSLMAIFAYFVRHDTYLQLTFSIPLVILLFGIGIWPESPRWLLVNEKWIRSEKCLRKMAAVNKMKYPDSFNLHSLEIRQANTIHSSSSPWKLLLSNRFLVVRLSIINAIWFTCTLISWSINFNAASLSGNIYFNTFLIGLVEIIGGLMCFFAINHPRIGRRFTTGLSLLFITVTSFISLFTIGTMWSTVMSLTSKCFNTVCFTAIYLYSCELLPTEIRTSAVGFASVFARIGGMAAPFVGGPLGKIWAPFPALIFGVSSFVVGVLCIWCLPETLGKKMPDTVEEIIISYRKNDGNILQEVETHLMKNKESEQT